MLSRAVLLATLLCAMHPNGGCNRTSSEPETRVVESITYEDVLQTAVHHARTQLNWESAVADPNLVLFDGRALVVVYLSPTIEHVDDQTRHAVISVDFSGEVVNVAEVNY